MKKNNRQIDIIEAIAEAENPKHIRAYQCHYCAHCDEYDGTLSPCDLKINPKCHNEATRCRAEFVPYEWYDRELQTVRTITIPAAAYDRRFKHGGQ